MGRQQWLREAEKQMVARDDCGIRVLFFKKKNKKPTIMLMHIHPSINGEWPF